MAITLKLINNKNEWNNLMRGLPHAHILQTWEWGDFKERTTGWKPYRWAFYDDDMLVALASVGARQILGLLQVMYAPKGPVFATQNPAIQKAVIERLEQQAKKQFAIWLKIDPDITIATGIPDEEGDTPYLPGQQLMQLLQGRGWTFSNDQVQFRNTVNIPLDKDENDILMSMSQSTRRKVRQAEKKGVTIRSGKVNDLPMLYDLYRQTGERDDFLIRPYSYYGTLWQEFLEANLAHVLIAEYEDKAIAHVVLFHFGQKCWYFYGASSNEERNRMPNYALQWEAMKWAKQNGYSIYDMWGAPNIFDESDGMWGVFQFKRGFRGIVTRHIGAWDYAPRQWLYRLYVEAVPRVRQILRGK